MQVLNVLNAHAGNPLLDAMFVGELCGLPQTKVFQDLFFDLPMAGPMKSDSKRRSVGEPSGSRDSRGHPGRRLPLGRVKGTLDGSSRSPGPSMLAWHDLV